MMHPSHIEPDVELKTFLTGRVVIGDGQSATPVTIYRDWERPTNGLPTDFIVVYMNGDPSGVGLETPFARGYLMVALYCKMNNDGSAKSNRIKKILEQFDALLQNAVTTNYHFEYDPERYITPTTPNQGSGYSVTILNLRWTTTANFNSSNQ